jgi:hypothetical protein
MTPDAFESLPRIFVTGPDVHGDPSAVRGSGFCSIYAVLIGVSLLRNDVNAFFPLNTDIQTMDDVRNAILTFARTMRDIDAPTLSLNEGVRPNLEDAFIKILVQILIEDLERDPKDLNIMQGDLAIRILAQLMGITVYIFDPNERNVTTIQGADNESSKVYLSVQNGHFEVHMPPTVRAPILRTRYWFELMWKDDVALQPHPYHEKASSMHISVAT